MSDKFEHDLPIRMVTVWDLPIRIFHWLISFNVIFLLVTGNIGGDWILWHIRAAYLLSGLIIFRILWGIKGSYYARFSSFIVSPIKGFTYLKQIFSGEAEPHYQHNPAGALMVLVLMIALSTQFLAGTVITDDIMWYGPFYQWVSGALAEMGTALHHQMEWVLIGLVILHIAAVMFHQFWLKEKIIQAMIHGKKHRQEQSAKPVVVNRLVLIGILVLSGIWVYWLWGLPI